MSEAKKTSSTTDDKDSATSAGRRLTTAQIRGWIARIVWTICLVIALFLAAAAFSYALDANAANPLIKLIRHVAESCDLGWFDLNNPLWQAKPPNALTKTALANYGIAAVAYMVVGRILERIIRP
ncbi:MAG: hypothetical protein FWE71_11705 [Nocardioidaceae bacterium]|nr:hypothetical protein [Nocardioidaceae bacterium]MCL2613744.1 hypothetical protein [Nocardioidaceae bacterium]